MEPQRTDPQSLAEPYIPALVRSFEDIAIILRAHPILTGHVHHYMYLLAKEFPEWRPESVGYKKKTINRPLQRQVWERDQYRCVHCGTWKNLTCDHIVPESLGGPTTLDNLQTLCQSCNSKKGTKE